MDYDGLITKFKINRNLTQDERKCQLFQKRRLDADPAIQFTTIRINSTYLETVDKYYEQKGALTMIGIIVVIPLFVFYIFMTWSIYFDPEHADAPNWLWLLMTGIFASLFWFVLSLSFKESLSYTHYPIRFNRKTRMIHVFRTNGTILTVPWDEVFFCINQSNSKGFWDIRGHVMEQNGVTVKDTFCLAIYGVRADYEENLTRYWEFIRRYMEDGPKNLVNDIPRCVTHPGRKETFREGFNTLLLFSAGLNIIFFIFGFMLSSIFAPGRWVAMQTSKIPVWPKEVEDVCKVEPDDPYVRDSSTNPPLKWGFGR